MKIATVIPLESKTIFDDLTYFTSKEVNKGDIVSILLRNKKTLGLVTETEEVSDSKDDIKSMPFNLKKITDVKGPSVFTPEFLSSAEATGKYFVTKTGSAIGSLIPSILKEKYDKLASFLPPKKEETNPRAEVRAEKVLLQSPYEDRISFYKTLIRESFAAKKSIFIVLPGERDIKEFNELLSKGIENFTVSIHSALSAKKALEAVEKIATTTHALLILATAPYLAIQREDIGTIAIEHESGTGYKMIQRPYFDLRVFAEIFASKIGAKLILADNLLSFETIGRRDIDHLGEVHPLSFRVNFEGQIEVVGKDKKFKILSDQSVDEVKQNIDKGKNTFIFSVRKGLATMTICRDCQDTLLCKKCSAPVVLYISRDGKKRMFICNRCKTEMEPDTLCQKCGSWNLMPLGIGTDTVIEDAKNIFQKELKEKGAKIFKLDRESAGTKKGAEEIIKEFENTPGSILVGTEMAFFYLKNKVHTSIIASFDSLWSIPNFRMSERIIRILLESIEKTSERLIIQTKNPNDPAIQAIEQRNLISFVRQELEDRQALSYPPFTRFIKIKHTGDKVAANVAKEYLAKIFAEYNPEIFSGFVAKVKGQYITNALIRIEPKKWSLPELMLGGKLDPELGNPLATLGNEYEIYVDPEDLL